MASTQPHGAPLAISREQVQSSTPIKFNTHHLQWTPDLGTFGYKDPLPAPSPAVQATVASINAPRIHEHVVEHDNAALLDVDDEGEHAPLLLTTLDLSQWTLILALVIKKDVDRALEQLGLAQAKLAVILDSEAEELELANQNTKLVDVALRRANPHESSTNSSMLADTETPTPHTLLGIIFILEAQKAALDDFTSSILNSQEEIDQAMLLPSGKGPVIPFTPTRIVECDVAQKMHRCWKLRNINLLVPISINMRKTWANLSTSELDMLKSNVVHNTCLLKEAQDISQSFPLVLYDHQKCSKG